MCKKYLLVAVVLVSILILPVFVSAQVINPGGPNQPCYTFEIYLSKGVSSQDVSNLQTILIKQNLLNISQPTGYFGNLTFNAVMAFQRKYGISQVGVVGPITRTKLNSLYGCGISSNQLPTINYLQPNSGAIGSSVTIMGSGFTPTGNRIIFGSTGIEKNPSYSLNSSDGRTIVFTVPSSDYVACLYSIPACMIAERLIQPGNYNVSVINSNGTSNQITFTATSQIICNPNWHCGWGPCNNGYQSMTTIIDSNNCGLIYNGPAMACPDLARVCN